jgi:hypothetical protein
VQNYEESIAIRLQREKVRAQKKWLSGERWRERDNHSQLIKLLGGIFNIYLVFSLVGLLG